MVCLQSHSLIFLGLCCGGIGEGGCHNPLYFVCRPIDVIFHGFLASFSYYKIAHLVYNLAQFGIIKMNLSHFDIIKSHILYYKIAFFAL